jgi:voltage-gated potassium channel
VIADRLDGQVIFLALPFLRFARIVARLRLRPIVRAGRVVSSTVRGTRIAGRELTSRAAWLLTVTVIVVLTSSQLLYEFAGYTSYAVALHDAAYATVTGEPLSAETGLARVMDLATVICGQVLLRDRRMSTPVIGKR